MNMKPIAWR